MHFYVKMGMTRYPVEERNLKVKKKPKLNSSLTLTLMLLFMSSKVECSGKLVDESPKVESVLGETTRREYKNLWVQ